MIIEQSQVMDSHEKTMTGQSKCTNSHVIMTDQPQSKFGDATTVKDQSQCMHSHVTKVTVQSQYMNL